MKKNLRHSLDNSEFLVYYQPVIDLKTNSVVSVEALLRWAHPGKGLVDPMEFIPVAEETGLIIPIGEWVMRTACHQLKSWQQSGFTGLSVAVNLSGRQLQHNNLVHVITGILEETGLQARHLELEITESTALVDVGKTVKILNRLIKKGICISMDDFGTGYSSLNYLKLLPIHTLKIDKSFVHGITLNSREEAIAEALITMTHKIGLVVTAEGVETAEQLDFLKQLGCDRVQGHLFSRALPVNEVEKVLEHYLPAR